MMRLLLILLFTIPLPALASGGSEVQIPEQEWRFDGPFGTYDRGSLQRGYQVYKEVCSACHAMKYIRYRNLEDIGFSAAEVKALAAQYSVEDGPNEEGEMFDRPAKPSDAFVSPFPNDAAAKFANGGALPPDLSLIVKAREHGANYIYALLNGFESPPADFHLMKGLNYNKYFPGHQISMAPPLSDDAVEYADGTPATVDQMARDVATFLAWTSEPEMEVRKRTGTRVILFLLFLAVVFYQSKKKIWAKLKK